MTTIYAAGFQASGANSMTITSVGGAAATITAGTYLPGAFTTANVTTNAIPGVAYARTAYTAFTAIVKSVFDAATASTFTVTFSTTTGLYTISRATNFVLTFSGASDLRLRAALGFSGNKTGTNTYTSDYVPDYVMLGTIGARSQVTGLQEDDDVGDEAVSDGGDAEVLTRKTDEFFSTWAQTMEPIAAVYRRSRAAAGSSAWTWEDFFKRTRGAHPFMVYDSTTTPTTTLHQFTAKGCAFKPERVTADFDDQWIVKFATRDLGTSS